jgi:hypothetical protein
MFYVVEKNSKSFGELGGIKLVLTFLSECCLDPSEKIQAVLTLAHALDAYSKFNVTMTTILFVFSKFWSLLH